jgi:DNA-binding Lrp family transcriptional regulator
MLISPGLGEMGRIGPIGPIAFLSFSPRALPCPESAARTPAAMSIDPLLQLLRRQARHSHQELAELLSLSEGEVRERLAAWEKNGTILGYQAVINPEQAGDDDVSAFIEVKVTPERGGGFDRLAMRIARFDQVVSCYLASGGYDLMVVVEGSDLREVARFVSEKLSTMDGVISTATHFRLKTYKENGFIFGETSGPERLAVSP